MSDCMALTPISYYTLFTYLINSHNRKRLLSLAAQKFVSDIAADAYQHARIRTNAQPAARVRTDKAGTTATATALARVRPFRTLFSHSTDLMWDNRIKHEQFSRWTTSPPHSPNMGLTRASPTFISKCPCSVYCLVCLSVCLSSVVLDLLSLAHRKFGSLLPRSSIDRQKQTRPHAQPVWSDHAPINQTVLQKSHHILS